MLWRILGSFIFVLGTLFLIGGLRFVIGVLPMASRGMGAGYPVGVLIGLAVMTAVTAVGLLMVIGTIP